MKPETKAKLLNTIYTILALSGMVMFIVTIIHPNWFSLISCGILIITALIAFFMAQTEIRKVEELGVRRIKYPNNHRETKITVSIYETNDHVVLDFWGDCGIHGTDEMLAGYKLTPKRLIKILQDRDDYTDEELDT